MPNVRHHIDSFFPGKLSEVVFGNTSKAPGHGHVPYNAEVDYFGLRTLMRPSVFLTLALPLTHPREKNVEFLRGALSRKEAFGSPFLMIKWDETTWKVSGHEGRHRMKAIEAEEGDTPVEVHLFPKDGMRRRHLDDKMIASLKDGLKSEQGEYVRGAVTKILQA